MLEEYQIPTLRMIVIFGAVFVGLSTAAWLYDNGYYTINPIKKTSQIELIKLEPNTTMAVNLSKAEQSSAIISAIFSNEIKVNSSLIGFDLLNKNESKKVIDLVHNDSVLSKRHFFNILIQPSNDSDLRAGVYEGFTKLEYNNNDKDTKDAKVQLIKLVLTLAEPKPK